MEDADTESFMTNKQVFEQNLAKTSKFFIRFLYKPIIVGAFLVVLPLFTSQAPEFINQSVHDRSWELIHLIFVGIAVSYGLFSRRNAQGEKENNQQSKFENAQYFISAFLQGSSVFDDEPETPSGSDENSKVLTWSNQYFRNEPVLVIEKQRGRASRVAEKPLDLPVRSLKSRVVDEIKESSDESRNKSSSLTRSSSSLSSKRFEQAELEEKLRDSVVLPSPIPWRSRSGRIDVKEEAGGSLSYSSTLSGRKYEITRANSPSLRSYTCWDPWSGSQSSSPRQLSPSPSRSLETQTKGTEDLVQKKIYQSPHPPPPPPPPIEMISQPSEAKPRPSSHSWVHLSGKNLRESLLNELNNYNKRDGEIHFSRVNSGIETKSRSLNDGLSMGKSVRTLRASETFPRNGRELGQHGVNMNAGFNETSVKTDRSNREGSILMNNPSPRQVAKEDECWNFVEKVVAQSDVETESEDDCGGGTNSTKEEGGSVSSNVGDDDGPDVDKKADEFIAKFREQIRLQRIESIKRSSAEMSKGASR